MSFNRITICGNLVNDPELKYLQKGTAVCEFALGTPNWKKPGSEERPPMTWFRCVIFGDGAENAARYLSKKTPVFVSGTLELQEYTGKDGTPKSALKVRVTEWQNAGPYKAAGATANASRVPNDPPITAEPANDGEDQDIPF